MTKGKELEPMKNTLEEASLVRGHNLLKTDSLSSLMLGDYLSPS